MKTLGLLVRPILRFLTIFTCVLFFTQCILWQEGFLADWVIVLTFALLMIEILMLYTGFGRRRKE